MREVNGNSRFSRLSTIVYFLLIIMLFSSALTSNHFINVQPVYANPEISNKALLVYGEGTLATPKYREWDGSTLGSEQTGPSMAGTVHYAVLKSCPTLRIGAFNRRANEKMLVVSEDGGDVYASVWNSLAGWGTVKTLGASILADATMRGFHVAYEQSSGDCIVVVRSGTDAKYWIWNGTSWIVDGTTLDLTVTTGNPVWIRLAADPASNETAMIWVDDNYDVGGAIWSGSSWGDQLLLDGAYVTSEMYDGEVIAVEYMANNGEAMFAWGADDQPTAADSGISSRIWNGASWDSQLAGIDIGDDGYPPLWLSLKADPNSNQLMLGLTDDALDAHTVRWSGTAWDTPVTHDLGIESGLRNSRGIDVEWENVTGHSGHAIVAWNSGDDALQTSHWDGSSWSSLAGTDPYAGLTDQHVIQLRRTGDDKIFVSMLDDNYGLHVWYWNDATQLWVWSGSGLGEIETNVSVDAVYEPFEFAPDVHGAFVAPVPPTVYLAPDNKTDLALTPPAEKYSLTLRPDGEGTWDLWYGQPGGTNHGDADYTNWDEATHNPADYNWIDEDYWFQSSTLEDSAGESWNIAKVKVTAYARANISNQDDLLIFMLVIGGQYRIGMEFSNLSTSFTAYSSTWGINPQTGDPWAWSEIDSLEAGVYTDYGPDTTWGNATHSLAMYVSQLYVEVLGPGIRFDLCVDYIEDCWQWQFEMTYNPDVLHGVWAIEGGNPVGVDPDGFLADEGGLVTALAGPGWNNTVGKLSLTGANLVGKVGAVTGGGRLAFFIMETVGKGETYLTLGSLTLIFNITGYFYPILGHSYFRNVAKADLPTASFTSTPQSPLTDPTEGYNMTFDASASTATGGKTIDEYKWYLGRNFPYDIVDEIVIETDATIERNYTMRTPTGKVYNVTLTVKDSDGVVASAKHGFEVLAHDIAILQIGMWDVSEAPDNVTIGETAKINVTVYNGGDYSETGITVTCYYRYPGGSDTLIGTVTGLSVNVAGETNAIFTWNTAGLTVTGTYIIWANTSAVDYEYVRSNNIHVGIGVRVKPGAVPEFPLGAAMEIALATVVVYLWWRSRRRRKPYETYSRTSLQALKRA